MRTALGRALLVLGGLLLLGLAWLWTQLPHPSGERIEVGSGVVGVDAGGSYVWILRVPEGAVLIDAGLKPDAQPVLAELSRQGLTPQSVKAVLLTHGHADHWGGATRFPDARVFVGEADIPLVRGERQPKGPLPRFFGAIFPPPPVPPKLEPLKGGEELELGGGRIRVIHVPGHTSGSVMFLAAETLFTGDSLLRSNGGVRVAPGLFSDDVEQNEASLRALVGLPFTRIADGHVGVTENARQKLEDFLARK